MGRVKTVVGEMWILKYVMELLEYLDLKGMK
jgi:hypothetical protein